METTSKVFGALGWLAVTLGAAWAGSRYRPDAWYRQQVKLSCTPPDWVFAPVWTVLYLLMAVAAWMVWSRHGLAQSAVSLGLFTLQLALNAAWTWLFFRRHQPGWALADLLALWFAIFATILAFWMLEPVAGILLMPYLAWVSFATALNGAIWVNNQPSRISHGSKQAKRVTYL